MSGDPYKHVQAGQPLQISAKVWNKFVDTSLKDALNQGRQEIGAPTLSPPTQGLTVRVKNDSGADVGRFGILKITGSVFDPDGDGFSLQSFENTPVLTGDVPDEKPFSQIVVTREPIIDGEIGRAVLSGVCVVTLDVNDADHTHAIPLDGDVEKLESALWGYRILYKESGTGNKKAYIHLGAMEFPLQIVITTETISPNTFGGFKFTTGAKGSESATGDEYQGFYRTSVATDPPDLPSGTPCYAIWVPCDTLTGDQTGWELSPCECIEEEE